ncbi:MAG TPA: tripartite tricarboxylate transporter substrate binding protein [Burkholderiales bacterium]|jgi:tripartite-type tricarboxylate transporter receptor subunit TctC|nr:tripartite tricarboxylate transporter substrate binding protein [Burkholderiales bacterium]
MQFCRRVGLVLSLFVAAWSGAAIAQTFPAKTIRLILPFPPGGPSDILGRAVAQKLTEQMGQTVITDNRAGAGGNLGLELTAKAPPDGYTLVLSSPLVALSPSLYSKLNYEQKDLAPVSLVALIQNVVLVHPSVPAKSLKDLVQIARASPGKLNYGSGGVGTTTHLAPELFMSMTKTKLVHVPYKGSGLALLGLISGQVDVLVMAVPAAAAQVDAGKARALAIVSEKRATPLPNVPTAKEAGFENFVVDIWYGILAPSGTPQNVVSRLNTELNKALASAELKEKLLGAGIQPTGGTPEQFASFIRSETARYAKVIKDAGIKPE